MIYLIGSLRNPYVPQLGNVLRTHGYEAFDDWYGAGPEADDYWQRHEKQRGVSYQQALKNPAARNVFRFDKLHLDKCDDVVLVMPAGKSGHLEFGYAIGTGKRGYVLFDKEPERWDVMYGFATEVCFGEQQLLEALRKHGSTINPPTQLADQAAAFWRTRKEADDFCTAQAAVKEAGPQAGEA